MNIFKVDGNLSIDTSNVYVNGAKTDLSVCKIDDETYCKLVSEGKCQENVLYVISSSYVNAYGEQVKNVASPTDYDDAATKRYVDDVFSQVSSMQEYAKKDEVA